MSQPASPSASQGGSKTGLLFVNLGTPDAPDTRAVRRYLRQFLSDPRVIDIHPVARALLLNVVILPFRSSKSAEAYRKIWTDRGSPLRFHSADLVEALRARLQEDERWLVELAMRYGNPSIESALGRLREQGADRVVVFPAYPQYSSASTGSTVEEVSRVAAKLEVTPHLSFIEPFYDAPEFIDAFARAGAPVLAAEKPDHVLFSFHGLPERHLTRIDAGQHCLVQDDCCQSIGAHNRHCYRAQCFATATALAARLGLDESGYSVSFQSRLGRTPWVKPYTDRIIGKLIAHGRKRLVVFCPAFVADCLETLEEIGIRLKADFLARGGESFSLVPSLNATPAWADAVVSLIHRQSQRFDVPASRLSRTTATG